MYPLHLDHCIETTKYMVVVLPHGRMSHAAPALNLSKSRFNLREEDLMPVQGDACTHLGTDTDFFSSKEK